MSNFPAQENRIREAIERVLLHKEYTWSELLDETLLDLDDWLTDPVNAHDAVAAVEEELRASHDERAGLVALSEIGVLSRVTDAAERLTLLADKDSRRRAWLDIAGYAVQAVIMLKHEINTEQIDYFEIRKNRLIRGFCPDCGEGVILRESLWVNRLRCSEGCGFQTDDIYELHNDFPNFNEMIEFLAKQPAKVKQK